MFATTEVAASAAAAGSSGPSLVVPREAVQTIGDDRIVFVPESETRFRALEVKVGGGAGKELEIVGGSRRAPGSSSKAPSS
jgi:hypothetical protein